MAKFLAIPRILMSAKSLNEAAHFLEKALLSQELDYLLADQREVLGKDTTRISLENYYEDDNAFGVQVNAIWRKNDEFQSATPLFYYAWDTIQKSMANNITCNFIDNNDPVRDDSEALKELTDYVVENIKGELFASLKGSPSYIDDIDIAVHDFFTENSKLVRDVIDYKRKHPFSGYESSFSFPFVANDRFLCFPRLLVEAESEKDATNKIAALKAMPHVEDILVNDPHGPLVKKTSITSFDDIDPSRPLLFCAINDGLRHHDETEATTKPYLHHWNDAVDEITRSIEFEMFDDDPNENQALAIKLSMPEIQDRCVHHLSSYDGYPGDLDDALKDFMLENRDDIRDIIEHNLANLENGHLSKVIENHGDNDSGLTF